MRHRFAGWLRALAQRIDTRPIGVTTQVVIPTIRLDGRVIAEAAVREALRRRLPEA